MFAANFGQNNGEFVTTEPSDCIDTSYARLQSVANQFDKLITYYVTKAIVNVFESVKVDK